MSVAVILTEPTTWYNEPMVGDVVTFAGHVMFGWTVSRMMGKAGQLDVETAPFPESTTPHDT